MTETAQQGTSQVLRISRVITETSDAKSIVFEVPEGNRERFRYQPGQFLTLRIPSERTGSVARCYSLASSPHVDDNLSVTVKRTADGYGSNWLCDNAASGDELEVLPPSGVFTPRNLDANLLVFAGGSGITPVMSILKSVLAQGTGRVVLVYANRDESSVIFREQLAELSRSHPHRLTVIHWLDSVQGIPSQEQLRALAAQCAGYECFVCGPGPFMAAVTDGLAAASIPKAQVHVEVFTSLSGDPFADVEAPAPDSDAETVPVEVEINATTHHLDWPATLPLVDLLLGNDIVAPYSCRDGECGSCQATLLKGKVTMIRNEVLGDDEIEEGYILGCQALPDIEGSGEETIQIEF